VLKDLSGSRPLHLAVNIMSYKEDSAKAFSMSGGSSSPDARSMRGSYCDYNTPNPGSGRGFFDVHFMDF
jgi:hypothetical protein